MALTQTKPLLLRHPEAAASTGADLLLQALEAEGVTTIFGYPGGAILPVYDALPKSGLRHILTRHEQGAVMAADGYARSSGHVGVCLVTSGPGVTNLITGLANAYLDSVPIVAVCGQIPLPLMGTDAFQEVDTIGLTLPTVKHSFLVRNSADISFIVGEALHIARSGRPGPVVIDLPKNVAADLVTKPRMFCAPVPSVQKVSPHLTTRAKDLIRRAERPLLYVGGGVNLGNAIEALREFVTDTNMPFVATLKGLGSLPTDHPAFLGMLGMHGLKAANFAVQDCDLLICAGARFDDRATGKLDSFAPLAKVIHIDGDPSEIGKLRTADIGLSGDLRENLLAINPGHLQIENWLKKTRAMKKQYAWRYDSPGDGVYAPKLLKDLSEAVEGPSIVTCDVGQHQMWVAQHYHINHPKEHLTSGGLGAMGYGIPAAIGAKLANPKACVIAVTGDGSIMMNIQELATLKRYNIGVKIVLLDNSSLGMVRQWQELFYEENYSETNLADNPDFTEVAKAFGLAAFSVSKKSDVPGAIQQLLTTDGPVLAHVRIDPRENLWPLVPPGCSNSEMIEAGS